MRFIALAAAAALLGAGSASALSCSSEAVIVTATVPSYAVDHACGIAGNDTKAGGPSKDLAQTLGTLFPTLTGDWQLSGKSDEAGDGVFAQHDGFSGTWSLATPVTGLFAITLKASTGFSVYAFNVEFDATGGTFDTALADLAAGNDTPKKGRKDRGKKAKEDDEDNAAGLSHLSIFRYLGHDAPPATSTPTTAVPLPAGIWLMLSVITGFGLLRRLKGRSAA